MKIARGSIERPILTWILILATFFGGIVGFVSLGRLEDPAFTIKTAVVHTTYPGASAEEVATEISEPLESAIQQIGAVDTIVSVNTPGVSLLEIELDPRTGADEVPAVWTELRAKVGDAATSLPQGCRPDRRQRRFRRCLRHLLCRHRAGIQRCDPARPGPLPAARADRRRGRRRRRHRGPAAGGDPCHARHGPGGQPGHPAGGRLRCDRGGGRHRRVGHVGADAAHASRGLGHAGGAGRAECRPVGRDRAPVGPGHALARARRPSRPDPAP